MLAGIPTNYYTDAIWILFFGVILFMAIMAAFDIAMLGSRCEHCGMTMFKDPGRPFSRCPKCGLWQKP